VKPNAPLSIVVKSDENGCIFARSKRKKPGTGRKKTKTGGRVGRGGHKEIGELFSCYAQLSEGGDVSLLR